MHFPQTDVAAAFARTIIALIFAGISRCLFRFHARIHLIRSDQRSYYCCYWYYCWIEEKCVWISWVRNSARAWEMMKMKIIIIVLLLIRNAASLLRISSLKRMPFLLTFDECNSRIRWVAVVIIVIRYLIEINLTQANKNSINAKNVQQQQNWQ